MDKKWGNKDWIWLVGILITIIILLISGFYNSKVIELNFSIISSAVSIALALVAIFIALKQDSDNQRVNDRLSHLLNEISINVRNVDAKVDKIDPRLLHSVTAEIVEEYNKESKEKESFTKDEVDKIVNKVSNDIASNINVILSDKDNIVNNDTSQIIWSKYTSKGFLEQEKVTNIMINNKNKSLEDLQEIIVKETGTLYTIPALNKHRKKIFTTNAM